MQQVWAIPGVLEKYLTEEECRLLRTCFAGLYSLDQKDNPQEVKSDTKLPKFVRLSPKFLLLPPLM